MNRRNNPIRLGSLLPAVVKALAAAHGKRLEDLLDAEELAQMGLENQPESVAEALVWEAANDAHRPELEGLVVQHPFWAYRLDFALPDLKIGFEIDGHAYHSDALTFDRDRKRHRQIELQGWRLVRFSGKEACDNPEQVVREMALAVRTFAPRVPTQGGPASCEHCEKAGDTA